MAYGQTQTGSITRQSKSDESVKQVVCTSCDGFCPVSANVEDGRVVKTIGDEVMCVFPDPVKAILASNEMQLAIQRASQEDRFEVGELRIKIGLHYGPGIEEQTDVHGEAHLVATSSDQRLGAGATWRAARADEGRKGL